MKNLKHFIFVMFFLSWVACNSGEIYHEFCSAPGASWKKDTYCDFEVEITDTIPAYDISLEVRNDNDYAYRNLWLFVTLTTPEGAVRSDTLNCELADEFGKWYGKGISLYTLTFPYEESFRFNHSGIYEFKIQHGMRDEELKGISDVGIRIRKNN